MSTFSKLNRRIVFPAILALAMLGVFLPSSKVSSSTSYPVYSYIVTYYSDASHTQEVGSRYINCNGHGTLTGRATVYQTSEIIDICCEDPGGHGYVPC